MLKEREPKKPDLEQVEGIQGVDEIAVVAPQQTAVAPHNRRCKARHIPRLLRFLQGDAASAGSSEHCNLQQVKAGRAPKAAIALCDYGHAAAACRLSPRASYTILETPPTALRHTSFDHACNGVHTPTSTALPAFMQ